MKNGMFRNIPWRQEDDSGITFLSPVYPHAGWTCYPHCIERFWSDLEAVMSELGWITAWDCQEQACLNYLATYTSPSLRKEAAHDQKRN